MNERDTDGLIASLGFLINNSLYGTHPTIPDRYVSREEIKELLERQKDKKEARKDDNKMNKYSHYFDEIVPYLITNKGEEVSYVLFKDLVQVRSILFDFTDMYHLSFILADSDRLPKDSSIIYDCEVEREESQYGPRIKMLNSFFEFIETKDQRGKPYTAINLHTIENLRRKGTNNANIANCISRIDPEFTFHCGIFYTDEEGKRDEAYVEVTDEETGEKQVFDTVHRNEDTIWGAEFRYVKDEGWKLIKWNLKRVPK